MEPSKLSLIGDEKENHEPSRNDYYIKYASITATSNVAFFEYIDHIHQMFATHITRAQFGYNRLIELNRVFGSSRVRRNTHGQYRMLTNNSALIVISARWIISFRWGFFFPLSMSFSLFLFYYFVCEAVNAVSLLYNRSFFPASCRGVFFSSLDPIFGLYFFLTEALTNRTHSYNVVKCVLCGFFIWTHNSYTWYEHSWAITHENRLDK